MRRVHGAKRAHAGEEQEVVALERGRDSNEVRGGLPGQCGPKGGRLGGDNMRTRRLAFHRLGGTRILARSIAQGRGGEGERARGD